MAAALPGGGANRFAKSSGALVAWSSAVRGVQEDRPGTAQRSPKPRIRERKPERDRRQGGTPGRRRTIEG